VSSLFKEIAQNVKGAVPLLLGFAAVLVLLPMLFSGGTGGSGTSVVIWGILSYYLHRAALFDLGFNLLGKPVTRTEAPVPPESIGRFLFLYLIFIGLSVVPALVVAFKIATPTEASKESFIGVILIVALPLMWVLLILFGTLFPAAAARQSLSPLAALRAARRTWWRIALQLLLLPFLYGVVMLFLLSKAYAWLEGSGLPMPVTVAVDILLTAVATVGQVLTVVVLTRAYRIGWPQTATAEPSA
jgi:hypothetical protein